MFKNIYTLVNEHFMVGYSYININVKPEYVVADIQVV